MPVQLTWIFACLDVYWKASAKIIWQNGLAVLTLFGGMKTGNCIVRMFCFFCRFCTALIIYQGKLVAVRGKRISQNSVPANMQNIMIKAPFGLKFVSHDPMFGWQNVIFGILRSYKMLFLQFVGVILTIWCYMESIPLVHNYLKKYFNCSKLNLPIKWFKIQTT